MLLKAVFWPIGSKTNGYCYGWDEPAVCVAGVIETDSRDEAERVLYHSSPSLQSRWARLKLLGTSTVDRRNPFVPILDLEGVHEYYIVLYRRHLSKSLRFYSLDALKLDASENKRDPKATFVKKQLQHNFAAPQAMFESGGISHAVVEQLNVAGTIDQLLQPRPHAFRMITVWFQKVLSIATAPFSPVLSTIGRTLNVFCNIPISFSCRALDLHYVVLKDISATIQQLDVRAEQSVFLAAEVHSLGQRDESPLPMYSAQYINFFNIVWLILNDITIGYAFGSFLSENHRFLADAICRYTENALIIWVQWVLRWLDSWPAGLKLNTELSWFYSYTFIDLVAMWGSVLNRIFLHLPIVIYVFGLISSFGGILGGMTMAISLFCDLLTVFTAHIYVCYVITNAVYARVLRTVGSLWNLFRGKRYNVLRNRTDSWEYDVDQLLFGTILFTLLAFLFPTVLVYYLLFALMRLGTILIQASLETQLAFMNHFPLFALMLRVKDPSRLPGGLYFSHNASPTATGPILVLENQPLSLATVFFQYTRLWARLVSHYNPLRLLKCLLAGEFLSPIPRYEIRYNKIREKGSRAS
ncbi:pig-Q [Marasmius sp. AFHP31]|nr:pig-Q [Marasmius sp. AFHP31]